MAADARSLAQWERAWSEHASPLPARVAVTVGFLAVAIKMSDLGVPSFALNAVAVFAVVIPTTTGVRILWRLRRVHAIAAGRRFLVETYFWLWLCLRGSRLEPGWPTAVFVAEVTSLGVFAGTWLLAVPDV